MSVRENLGALLTRFYSKQQADKTAIADLSGINTKSAVTLTNNSVSPKTGYAVAQMTSDVAGVTAGYLYVDGKPVCGNRVYFQSPDSYILLAPVSKGAQVLVDKVNATVKSITVYGLQVGGGKETVDLLQLIGGAVCLNKTLKRCSIESHCRNRTQELQSQRQRLTVGSTTLMRRATAMCIFLHTIVQRSVSRTQTQASCIISAPSVSQCPTSRTVSQLKKATALTCMSVAMLARSAIQSACSSRSKVNSFALSQEVSYV